MMRGVGVATKANLLTVRKRISDILILSAMPNASCITYDLEITLEGERASLRSYSDDNKPIGDDRPYEILKARFNPLRSSANEFIRLMNKDFIAPGQTFSAKLDLQSGVLEITIDEVPIAEHP